MHDIENLFFPVLVLIFFMKCLTVFFKKKMTCVFSSLVEWLEDLHSSLYNFKFSILLDKRKL